MHDKFTHRETTTSREIKLLKNKFELLEKSRQFRSIMQKSQLNGNLHNSSDTFEDANSFAGAANAAEDANESRTSEVDSQQAANRADQSERNNSTRSKSVRIKLPKMISISRLLSSMLKPKRAKFVSGRSNRVSSTLSSRQDQNQNQLPKPSLECDSEKPKAKSRRGIFAGWF